ncbi:MAG: hypothetical protein V2I33_18450 [Kangiellaceae bacterium]|jgi:hypothetical protein|nr:hypothetical protein [Kangiellaceae bacterium]
MAVELVQSMSMGPNIKSLNYTLWYIGMMASIDLSNVIDMKEGTFWVVVNAALAIAPVYFGLYFAIKLKI